MSALLPLDFSPPALLPNKDSPDTNKKCIVIAKVIKEIAENTNMDGVKQEMLQQNAARKLQQISVKRDIYPLLFTEVNCLAFALYRQSVSAETAKEYYSFLLPDEMAKKWTVILI